MGRDGPLAGSGHHRLARSPEQAAAFTRRFVTPTPDLNQHGLQGADGLLVPLGPHDTLLGVRRQPGRHLENVSLGCRPDHGPALLLPLPPASTSAARTIQSIIAQLDACGIRNYFHIHNLSRCISCDYDATIDTECRWVPPYKSSEPAHKPQASGHTREEARIMITGRVRK